MYTYILGLSTGLSLILAIGSQNAFILKQGLKRQYVGTVALICALSDAILITIGVYGLDYISSLLPSFSILAKYFGVAFLLFYAIKSFMSAYKGQAGLAASQTNASSWTKTILICLAFTWLNPHVYLDTVVLIGSIATQYPQKLAFTIGAVSASFFFFFALAYSARLLAPTLAKPICWRILDTLIGIMMVVIAFNLWHVDI